MWKEAEDFLLRDKKIAPLVIKWGSCRIKKRPQKYYFEDLVASITEQQLSGKAAEVIFKRVRTLLKKNSSSLLSPIAPKDVEKVKEEELRACGISWSKAKYVKDLGEKVSRGEVNLKRLGTLSDEEVVTELIKVKGVGRWTAEMFLMFTLARPDIFPLDDLGIRKAMEKMFGKKLDKPEILKKSTNWKQFRTVASWYLWRSLETT